MNIKNLPLKLAFVGLMVALCLYWLFTKGLRGGIDIMGGYSLVFEIRTNEAEIRRLKTNLEDLKRQLKQAETEQKKKELTEAIERVKANLDRVGESIDEGNLAERMIEVLKKRVDPRGLMNLEWRPQGNNKIEVRMPAGKEKSRQAKNLYLDALEKLQAGNIHRGQWRRVLRAAPEQREAEIDALAGDDAAQRRRLDELAKAYDAVGQARQRRDDLKEKLDSSGAAATRTTTMPSDGEIAGLKEALQQAQAALDNATTEYEGKIEGLEEGNINLEKFQALLGTYIPQVEAGSLSESELEARRRQFDQRLTEFARKYPARTAEIGNVARLYKAWADVRQYLDDPADLKRLIAKAGVLEFRIAPLLPASSSGPQEGLRISQAQYRRYLDSLRKEGPEAGRKRNEPFQWFAVGGERKSFVGMVTEDYAGKTYILLYNQPGFVMLHETGRGGWTLKGARPGTDNMGLPAVHFEFDEAGARRSRRLTSAHVGHNMAVLLDDEVYSAPTIKDVISNRGQITGRFTGQEVADLVRILEAGSLPARLNREPISENHFDAAIGVQNRERGKQAAYWGLIAVAAFMFIYYLLAGSIADLALVLNIVLVLGAMSMLNAVFTLPGIAGIILTIGIAVDANVLIFERLREEQAKGTSVRMAIKNAYQRAFSAIFDANITTLITCLILGWVGTQEIRGFAITLSLGIVFSMFTALVVTRWVFQLLLQLRLMKKPVFMLHVMGVPKIDWISKRHFFWCLSAVMVIMGAVSLVWQGGKIWGIEFTSGTQVVLKFKDDALINNQLLNDGAVRELFIAKARQLGPDYERLATTARVETLKERARIRIFLDDHDLDSDGRITPDEWKAQKLQEGCFSLLDTDGDGALVGDELAGSLPSGLYQISTTETRLERIKHVAREAFGKALKHRTRCDFELLDSARSGEFGIVTSTAGKTRITPLLWRNAAAAYRDDLEEYAGGVLFVARNVAPAISPTELLQRIRDLRTAPDFAGQLIGPPKVIPLGEAQPEGYGAFAVMFRPADASSVEGLAAWQLFADTRLALLTEAFGREDTIDVRNFDPAIAGEAAQRAVFAVVLSWLAIVVYLWFRFGSAQWGLAAVVCLVHDVVIVVGLVAVSGWLHDTFLGRLLGVASFKIDLAMVAAILTVIGYSVNDTIVVFDRIRENRGKLTAVSSAIINSSINQTLPRTLLTSFTTFLVVFIMYIWGGAGIHAFNYALLCGILFGTYSSIAVASPLLLGFKKALVERAISATAK